MKRIFWCHNFALMIIDVLAYYALAVFIVWLTLLDWGELVIKGRQTGRMAAATLLMVVQLMVLFGGAALWGPHLLLLPVGLLAGYLLFYLKRSR